MRFVPLGEADKDEDWTFTPIGAEPLPEGTSQVRAEGRQDAPMDPRRTDAPEPEKGVLGTMSDSLARGVPSLIQGVSGTQLRSNAGILGNIDDVEKKLAAGRRPETFTGDEDPYSVALMTPQQRAEFRQQAMGLATRQAGEIAAAEATKAQYPQPAVVDRVMKAKTWGDAVSAFSSDPVKFVAAIGPESLMSNAPGLVAGAVMPGGVAMKAATMGAGSAATDYGSQILQGLQRAGVDLNDPDSIMAAAKNPQLMAEIARTAISHAGPVGAIDAASGGAASKVLLPAKRLAGKPVARELTNIAVQTPVQGALGGAGEVAGSVLSGQEIEPGNVLAEIVGESFGTPAEVASVAGQAVRDRMARPATSFTEPGSPSARAGLTPIVVPVPDAPITVAGEPNVGNADVPGAVAGGGGAAGGAVDAGGVATAGRDAGVPGSVRTVPEEPGAPVQPDAPVRGGAGERPGALTNPAARTADDDLLRKAETESAKQEVKGLDAQLKQNGKELEAATAFLRKSSQQLVAAQTLGDRDTIGVAQQNQRTAEGRIRALTDQRNQIVATRETALQRQMTAAAPQPKGDADGQQPGVAGTEVAAGPRAGLQGEEGDGGRGDSRELPAVDVRSERAGGAAEVGDLEPARVGQVLRRIENARLKVGEAVKLEQAPPSGRGVGLAQKLARVFGMPTIFVRAKSGKASFIAANVDGINVLRADHKELPLAATVHEVVHSLPADIKAKLIAAVKPTFRNVDRFKKDFGYTDQNADEELTAVLAQQQSKTPEFWRELRSKLGEGDFAKLADHILQKLDTLLKGFKKEDLSEFTTDIEAVRAALTDAYAEAAQRRASAVDEAAQAAATSKTNDLAEPTDAQKQAGNYKVGRVKVAGLDISIENPEGSERSGKSPDGKIWRTTMKDHYGYIRGADAVDGDKLDVFIKPGTDPDFAGPVWVIDQRDPRTGEFDEHKVIMGATDEADARAVYQRNYSKGWDGLGSITEMSLDDFKEWIANDGPMTPADPAFGEVRGAKSAQGVIDRAKAAGVNLELNESPRRIDLMLIERGEAKKGSGRAVMEDLVRYADQTGKTIYLDVKGDAGQLGAYYESFGFDPIARVPGRPEWEAGMRRKPGSTSKPKENRGAMLSRKAVELGFRDLADWMDKDPSGFARENLSFSERRADFTDPEERVEVSTTRPRAKGLEGRAYDKKLVIDGDDVRKSERHVKAIADALRTYNTLSGKGNAKQLMEELHDTVVKNLLWLHDLVPADIRARAKLWYDGANRIASEWQDKYSITKRQASGVLAVLSPQMDWFKNVSLAERVINVVQQRGDEAWSPAMTAWVQSWVNASKTVDEKAARSKVLADAKRIEGKKLSSLGIDDAAKFVRVFDETYHERRYRLVTPEGGFGDYVTKSDDGESSVTWGGFDTIGKAVSILRDGSFRNVEAKLGDEHKVRNFFNNIIAPQSGDGHVTIDTHAVAAALIKGLSGSSREVADNFGAAGSSAETGASGTYGLFADAYRDAAAKRGVLPREMQSITWEAVRALFPAAIKDKISGSIDKVWDRFKAGEITREQARDQVMEIAGGIRPMAWEGSDEGSFASDGATSFNTDIAEKPEDRAVRALDAVDTKDRMQVSLSAATNAIPGIAELYARAGKGDDFAHALLHDIALDSLRFLMGGTSARIKEQRATGLYGGASEPSLGLQITFTDSDRDRVLSALAKFAENFEQEQVHVRRATKDKVGTTYGDGSYVTPVYRWTLQKALTRKQVQAIIDKSGLYGLTFGDDFVEAYYVGDPADEAARAEFDLSIGRADQLLGKAAGRVGREAARLWAYGRGQGAAVGFDGIRGELAAGPAQQSETARRVAEYLNQGSKVKAFEQAKDVSPEQAELQRRIAATYEALPDNDLKNPRVKRAYQELAKEVVRQFKALPIKVEVFTGKGEPYASSAAMRRDVLENNHLFIFGTTPETYGPPGEDFSGHPLLGDAGLKDINGYPLLFNDLLRAVHDYFAHNMSATQFGPKGEEAAWKNHMASTPNAWARWALTSETRGQNSWVNFRPGADKLAIKDREFARQKAALLPVEYSMTGDRQTDAPMRELMASLPVAQRVGSKPVRDVEFSEERATDTPEFKRWFGDSKVVDAEGKPLVVYHATRADFNEFRTLAVNELGAHFGTAAQANKIAAGLMRRPSLGAARTVPVYLSIENPLRLKDDGSFNQVAVVPQLQRLGLLPAGLPASQWGGESGAESVKRAIESAGYDGVVYENTREGKGDSWIAFRPEQIKSAIGNRGTFSSDDARIDFSEDRRPYGAAPDNLMGFRKSKPNTPFAGQKYKHVEFVRVTWPDGNSMLEAQRGLNKDHALERARRNWADAEIVRVPREVVAKEDPELVREVDQAMEGGVDFSEERTDSDAFKKWFGESKVVDDDGKPLVVYHGSPVRDFDTFDLSKVNASDPDGPYNGFFFSANKEDALRAGRFPWGRPNAPDAQVRSFYLSIKNPASRQQAGRVASKIADNWDLTNPNARSWQDATREELQKLGYDGIVHTEPAIVTPKTLVKAEAAVGEQVALGKSKFSIAKQPDGEFWIYYDGVRNRDYDMPAGNIGEIASGVYVAFRPEQIKSATENRGTFSSDSDRIDFANKRRPASAGYGQQLTNAFGFPVEDETRTQKFRRIVQDYFLRVKTVQDAVVRGGGIVDEKRDVYRAEERMYGRVQSQLDDFAKGWVKPMLEKAAKAGIELDELALYAYAKHAPERNAAIDAINPGLKGAGSGMTDADAAAVIAAIPAAKLQQFEDLRQDLLAITEVTRRVLLDEGLITQDEYDAWTQQYQDYVPLRGFDVVNDETGAIRPGSGRGFNIRGKESLKALGRKSRAGDIIENIVRDYQRAVIRAERNAVGKVFLDLAVTNPDPTLWEVNATAPKRSQNRLTGLVSMSMETDKGSDTVAVKVSGREVYIRVHDDLLLRAMRKASVDESGQMQRALAASLGLYNDWMRNTLTRYNPVFAVTNSFKDAQTGAVSALDELGAAGAAKYSAYYRAAMAASFRNETDSLGKTGRFYGDPAMDKAFEEFKAAGGTTGGWFLRDPKEIERDLRQLMVAAGAAPRNTGERITGSKAWQGAKAVLRYVELFGAASENASRVAAYRAARDLGRTPAQAASIAKNLTTNFNRKGEWGTGLNSLYLFFNAAVQGTARTLQALKNPKVLALMAGVTGTAAALALANAELGGDDDDGEAFWDKIPDFEKEKSLIIMLPPGEQLDGAERVGRMGRYVKIPLPYGFNVFPVLGYQIADVGRYAADRNRGVSPAKAAINMVSAVAGSYNPLGGSFDPTEPTQVAMAVAPTIVDAGIQLGAGVNNFGRPVGPKSSGTRPDSESFTPAQAGTPSQKLARWMNSVTGGNEARSGGIDVMPGTLDNVVRLSTGGVGVFLRDTFVNMPSKLVDPEATTRARDVPFLRNVFGQVDENVDRGVYYERINEVLAEAKVALNEMKMGIDVKYDERSRGLQTLGKVAESYTQLMTSLRKEELRIVDDPDLTADQKKAARREVESRRNEFVRQFNELYLETIRDVNAGRFAE